MPRRNGSYFGFTAAPTPTAASGIWRVSEAEQYLRENKWPATPGVPGSPSGTPGDGQVALTWSAPTLGSPPTDYEVQYSSNAGSTWTTFSDGAGTTTSATVTGLTNGTGYIFRVRALNALGEGPYGSASGTITPFTISAELLLHFDGTNGSTTFTDSSGNGLTVTGDGTAEISTAESKFGGASGVFDGADSVVNVDYGSWAEVGTGDFTLEAWIYPTASGYQQIFGRHVYGYTSMYLLILNGSNELTLFENSTGSGQFRSSGISVATNEWSHVAISRESGTVRMFVNGVAGTSHTITGTLDQLGGFDSEPVGIGGPYNKAGWMFSGYIDELRLVKGTAVYTAAFTPPTAAF